MRAGDCTFVDTNVLLYSVDPSDVAKRARAREWIAALWESGSGRLSWQVLNEFYLHAVRKNGAKSSAARATVKTFASWQPAEQRLLLMERAWYWMDQAQTSYWDSLILAAAERPGCNQLLSEDFQSGRKYGKITAINPFLERP